MAFTSAERDLRWERARRVMAERGWQALLISGEDGLCGGNLRYLADFRPVKGRSLLLLPLEGEPVLWVEHRVHEQAAQKLSFVADARFAASCGEAAADELAERGLGRAAVGSDELALVPAAWYVAWTEGFPDLRLEDASRELAGLRRVKSVEEIELCRRSAELADGSYDHVLPKLREGISEFEIDAELEYDCRLHGAERMFNVYATSSLAELPWAASGRRLEHGRAALLEISPQLDGYCNPARPGRLDRRAAADPGRDAPRDAGGDGRGAGGPAARRRARRAARPDGGDHRGGRLPGDGHRHGHDLGCTLGESVTWLTRETAFEAEPGQVFEIHPVVLHPDGGCLLIGDTYLITETGVERLNRSARELAVV